MFWGLYMRRMWNCIFFNMEVFVTKTQKYCSYIFHGIISLNTGDTPDYSNSLIFSWTQPVIDVKQFSDWWLAIPCDIKRSDICWVIFSVLSSNPFRLSSRFWGQLSWFSSHSSKFLDVFTKNCQNWANSTNFLTQLGKRKLSWQNRWKNYPDFLALLSVRLFSILFFSWFSSVYSFDDLFNVQEAFRI